MIWSQAITYCIVTNALPFNAEVKYFEKYILIPKELWPYFGLKEAYSKDLRKV